MPDPQLTTSRAPKSIVKGSRSTALKPIIWMTGILAPVTLAAIFLEIFHGVPKWAGIFFCTATGLSVLLYIVAYLYFMIKDQNALRSEKYVLEKLPMEGGAIGDIQILFQPDRQMLLPRETADELPSEYQVRTPLTVTEQETARTEEKRDI
ncbi:MAG TPA: hypothetical protein VFD58_29900 [Blastocatellia bacterium]|nr:hypothetical protein [Blastocatellia bacterium]